MKLRFTARWLLAGILGCASLAAPLSAQDGVGFRFTFGQLNMAGDLGEVLDAATDAEFTVLVPAGPVRIGGGAGWASFPQTGADASWSQVKLHAGVLVPFQVTETFRPYAEGRVTFRRLRPEDDRFFGGEERLLRDFVASGTGFEGVFGAQVDLHPRMAVDVSASVGTVKVSPDLSEEGLDARDSGTTWGLRLGVSWFPLNGR